MGQDMGGELRALLETGQSQPQTGRLQPHGTLSITEVFDSFKASAAALEPRRVSLAWAWDMGVSDSIDGKELECAARGLKHAGRDQGACWEKAGKQQEEETM